jgi:hypothetical protein
VIVFVWLIGLITCRGIDLYPWEKSIEEVVLLDASTRLSKFRDYLHDPQNYWSFFVKDHGDGYFIADYSQYWKPGCTKDRRCAHLIDSRRFLRCFRTNSITTEFEKTDLPSLNRAGVGLRPRLNQK